MQTAIYFNPPNGLHYPPEEFREVTNFIVKDVKPYYLISNYGRLWSTFQGKMLLCNVDSKGYLYKPLATENGPKNCRIHRLVLMTFNYIPGCENLIINHIDGNKSNPVLWNLEWSNFSDNGKHAWDNELRNERISSLSEKEVEIVCNLLMTDKFNFEEIAKLCNTTWHIVSSICNKRAYKKIADKYDFPQKKGKLSDSDIHKICKYFSNNPRGNQQKTPYCTDVLLSCNIEVNSSTLNIAERLLYRQNFDRITKYYNY